MTPTMDSANCNCTAVRKDRSIEHTGHECPTNKIVMKSIQHDSDRARTTRYSVDATVDGVSTLIRCRDRMDARQKAVCFASAFNDTTHDAKAAVIETTDDGQNKWAEVICTMVNTYPWEAVE